MALLEEQGALSAASSPQPGASAHAANEHIEYFRAGDEIIRVAVSRISAQELEQIRKSGEPNSMPSIAPSALHEANPGKTATLPSRDRTEDTRSRLLNATIKLLESKGFSRFRVADAVALAGVSRGAQTHHFATKDELIDAAIRELFETEVERAYKERDLMPEGDLLARAAEHIEAFIHGDLYRVSLHLLIAAGFAEHFADGVRSISAQSRGALDQLWIDRFVDAGVSVDNAEEAFGILSSSLRGLLIQERIGDEPGDIDAVKALMLGLVRRKLNLPRDCRPE